MDWAEALAGFNDAEQDALGELFWLEDKKTTAVIGSVTESLEIESGGYLKNESLQANIKSLAGLGLKKKPAVNSLVELRGKVWRIHEVEALERDTGFNLMLEYVPDLASKYPTIKPEEPAPVEALELNSPQAQRPVNVSASLLANLVTNLTAEASPASPVELIAFEILAPIEPTDITSSSNPTLPFNVNAITTPLAPTLPSVDKNPNKPYSLLVYTEDPDFNFPTDFSPYVGSHKIIHLQPYFNNRHIAINYPAGYIWRTAGLDGSQTLVRAEDPAYPRAFPYTGSGNSSTGNWAWLKISDRGTKWEFAKNVS